MRTCLSCFFSLDFFLLLFIGLNLAFSGPLYADKIPDGICVLLNGDFPDPTVVKDGNDYYMTTSCGGFPSLMIWHSTDLLHWERLNYALSTSVEGAVWAPELIKYAGLFYLYFPVANRIFVMTAEHPTGPWSEPKSIEGVQGIDPGHIADREGNRYLYVDNGRIIRLASDGLSMCGKEIKVYDGWKFGDNYGVECFCLESPKAFYYNDYFYMISAQGGTGGPATSHMATVARAKSVFGPYENSPYNPLIKTWSPYEHWRSKGHATVIEGPDGKWYALYHAYENGQLPVGRKTLMEPVVWTKDGWIKSGIKKPEQAKTFYFTENVRPINDDFTSQSLHKQWLFTDAWTYRRAVSGNGYLQIACRPDRETGLLLPMCDPDFEVQFRIEPDSGVEAGLVIYYNSEYYAGMKLKDCMLRGVHKNKQPFGDRLNVPQARYFKLNVRNFNVYIGYSADGRNWISYPNAFDVSGYHSNILDSFGSLKIGVIGTGAGKIKIGDFKYNILKE